ncbi:MAG: hypothetical protein RLZ98_1532 [Pseudomonadota bacterium]|jgi:hypothetical protein
MQVKYRPVVPAALSLLMLAYLSSTPAHADRIDGEWCNAGLSMRIEGPKVTTPAGNVLEGTYGRHDFTYVVPPGETGTGTRIDAELVNEEEMRVKAGPAGAPVVWRRCRVTS